ncbi:MAG: hypothetical protein ACLT0D_04280, partial [Anaerovoracaceae bacterium]
FSRSLTSLSAGRSSLERLITIPQLAANVNIYFQVFHFFNSGGIKAIKRPRLAVGCAAVKQRVIL